MTHPQPPMPIGGVPTAPPPVSLPASAAPLTVECRRDVELRGDDASAFERLVDSHAGVGVFLSRAWLSGLFAEPPAGFEPALLLLRESGVIRGVAAIGIRQTLARVRVTLLGGGVGSDRVDLLAVRGFGAVCADAFLGWLGESFGTRGFVLELRDVPGDSPLWGAIHRAGTERTLQLALEPREIYALPYLDLKEPGSAVNSLERHRRWLERRGNLRIDLLQEPGEVMAAFELLVQLLHARWDGYGSGSGLDDPRAQRFHRHVIPLLLREGRLRMIRLACDTRTVGVFYGFASGGWWGYYLLGYDREWAGRIHLGRITLATAIDAALQEGAVEFDFLKGADRVKYLWPVRERVTVDADVYSGGSGAQLTRATRATREAAVALAKSARDLFPL